MTMEARVSGSINIAGLSIVLSQRLTASGHIGHTVTLPAGKASVDFTKTDGDTGMAELATGHGIATSDVVDVYWADGVRYGMVAAVSGNEVTVEGGAGDDLPASETDVVVSKVVNVDTDFAGDDIEMIVIHSTKQSHVAIHEDSGGTVLLAFDLKANSEWSWASYQPATNPLVGDAIGHIRLSAGETASAICKVGVLYNSEE